MKLVVKRNRELAPINSQNTQNENRAEIIELIVPEEYESYNKKIVFITPDGNLWDVIVNNQYKITNAITKYNKVDYYIWLTKEVNGESIDFRTKTKTLNFYHNVDASDEITDEEIHGVNTVVNLLEEEIEKVENLNIEATKIGSTTTVTITKKDGTTESVEINDGADGQDGQDGYTPQKGIDYFTEQDIEEIEGDILNEVYTKEQTDTLLEEKADVEDIPDVSSFITKDVNNLTNYTLKTNTGSLIDLEINSTTYVVTLKLKNQDGTIISTDTIDLPLESVVVSGRYDNTTKKVILTLENGSEVDFSVADLVAGLQTEITSQNKLASDLVDDTNSGNKFVTTSEKQTWNNKLDESDLTDYVKNTDYATDSKGGTIRTGWYNMGITSGHPLALTTQYSNYSILDPASFISKGTLENVITGKQLINQTQLEDSQDIQDEDIEKLQEENARLKATLPTTTGEGQDITLDKTAEFEFVKPPLPMGNSEQVTRILPEGYTQLDYIESTGTQYIDTGYKPTNLTEIEISFYLNGVAVETSSSQQLCLFGCYDNNNWWLLGNYKVADDMFGEFIWAGGKASANLLGYSKQKISFINGIYTDSSGNTKTVNISTSKTSQQNLYIMARNKNGNAEQYFNGKIYTFKMWESNVLIRNYIPCKNANNEIGLYDLITNTFYGNSGTGTFVAGNEAIIPNPDYPQEITNVTGDVEVKVQNIENFLDWNKFIDFSNWETALSPGYMAFKIDGLKVNTKYTLCRVNDDGYNILPTKYAGFNAGKNNTNRFIDYAVQSSNLKSVTATTNVNGTLYIVFHMSNATQLAQYIELINNCWVIEGESFVKKEQQTFTFPLGNEKLMLGDYLADDGIHHVRGQVILKGTEDWHKNADYNDYWSFCIYTWINNQIPKCNIAQGARWTAIENTEGNYCWSATASAGFRIDKKTFNNYETATTNQQKIDMFKAYLAEQYQNETPVIVEYELEEEQIVPYTSAQQEVYNQIKQALSYEEQTNIIGSSNGSNPIFNVEAYQNTKLILQDISNAIVALGGV